MTGLSIFSTHPLHPLVTADLKTLGKLHVASAPSPAAIIEESAGAEIVVVRAPIPVQVLQRAPNLRALIRHGAGLDMIPVSDATAAGVLVANVPGANALTVAEHAIWSAMALLRRHPQVNHDLRAKGWAAGRAHADFGRELSGRSIGILGMGNIGREIARIARFGFGMTVACHTRSAASVPEGVALLGFDALLATSDIVVLCAPLTEATHGILNATAIARMRPGAILVNVARGPLIDEVAVAEALSSGHLGGAALDVFTTQPLPGDHPFMALSNVILTPHMAGITEESMLRMGKGVVAEIRRILAGERPANLCNPEVLARYHQRFPTD